ncbi:MAG: tetratricopeptide repeat protein [Methylophilaceae bacterium]|nr:tetratricopeptide repeat protein [Methyloradius sp.]
MSQTPQPTKSERGQAETLYFEGNALLESGDLAGAEACWQKAIALVPDFAEAYCNIGFVFDKKGAPAEAESYYRTSLSLDPNCTRTLLNLGAFLAERKRFDEAAVLYDKAIVIDPGSAVAWTNLGILHTYLRSEQEAERCYRLAMQLDPEYKNAQFNLSYLLLREGRFEEGWQRLESRNWYATLANHFTCPRWQGEPLSGKSLVIGYEAGHGDMIQFYRYALVLKEQWSVSITLICHPALKRLFEMQGTLNQVLSFEDTIPQTGWDYWTPLMSLPYRCETRIETIPATIPYIKAPAGLAAKWTEKLPENGLRVGLVWKGNPKFENDIDRSIPSLQMLAPLGNIPNIQYISLQKGAGEDEAENPPAGLPIIHLGGQIQDFADTAAIVATLDLVICVDTAIAHLAGAMDKPCWVLLPYYMTDWRWMNGRTDSPWYPDNTRLFRQSKMGVWGSVINEVAQALSDF